MTDERITVEREADSYADVRVDGTPVASIDLKENNERYDGDVRVLVFDPKRPEDSDAEYVYDLPDDEEELSHEEKLTRMAWWRVRLKDKGAGRTGTTLFVQGWSEENVRERVEAAQQPYGHLNPFDPWSGTVEEFSSRWSEVEKTMLRVGGPNEALDQEDNRITRSDVRGGDE